MKEGIHRWYVFRRLKQSGYPYPVDGPYETQAEAALKMIDRARSIPGGEFAVADVVFSSDFREVQSG